MSDSFGKSSVGSVIRAFLSSKYMVALRVLFCRLMYTARENVPLYPPIGLHAAVLLFSQNIVCVEMYSHKPLTVFIRLR